MTLPVVELSGAPFDQGRQHGLALADQIKHNLEVYYDRFQREAQLAPEEVRERASRYRPVLQQHKAYFETLQGIAEASGQAELDLVMLNVRYELLYYQYSVLPVGKPDGCTSFALLPHATDTGHLLLGENWDWIPEVQGALLHTRDEAVETLTFTEAGIVGGKIGLNSAGLGLAINGLLSTSDDWSRLETPFHVRCYEVLRQPDISAAASVITTTRRACSTNFVLAQAPDRAVNVEAAPDTACTFSATRAGTLAHTNHFLEPDHLGIEEPLSERRPHTHTRLQRMQELLDARRPLSVGDVQACLRDHDNYPDSVCRHVHPEDPAEEACVTITSVVMDLHDHALWITDGAPCEHLYEQFRL